MALRRDARTEELFGLCNVHHWSLREASGESKAMKRTLALTHVIAVVIFAARGGQASANTPATPRLDTTSIHGLEDSMSSPDATSLGRAISYALGSRPELKTLPGNWNYQHTLWTRAEVSPVGEKCADILIEAHFEGGLQNHILLEGEYCLTDRSAWEWSARFQRVVPVTDLPPDLLTPGQNGDLPNKFDLTCIGDAAYDEYAMRKSGQFSTSIRIDLNRKLFCSDSCQVVRPLSHVDDGVIEYHCDTRGGAAPCPRSDIYTSEESDHWSISRPNLSFLDMDYSFGGDVAAVPHHFSRTGKCTVQPFSGFNGEFLYPEEASGAEPGASSEADDSSQFADAFGKSVLLRVIAAPKFGRHYAIWLSRDQNTYQISSTRDERCDRQIDGGLAERIVGIWQASLQLTDASVVPTKGNRAIFHFSMGRGFSVPAGWAKEPESPRYSRSDLLVAVAKLMAGYCETGESQGLEANVRTLEKWPQ